MGSGAMQQDTTMTTMATGYDNDDDDDKGATVTATMATAPRATG